MQKLVIWFGLALFLPSLSMAESALWYLQRSLLQEYHATDQEEILNPQISQNIFFKTVQVNSTTAYTSIYYNNSFIRSYYRYYIGFITTEKNGNSVRQFVARANPEKNTPEKFEEVDPNLVFTTDLLTIINDWSTQDYVRNKLGHRILSYLFFVQRYVDQIDKDTRELEFALDTLQKQITTLDPSSLERKELEARMKNYIEAFMYFAEYEMPKSLLIYSGLDIFIYSPGFIETLCSKLFAGLTKYFTTPLASGATRGAILSAKLSHVTSFIGKPKEFIVSASEKAFGLLPKRSQIIITKILASGAKPIIGLKNMVRVTAGRIQLTNELFAANLAAKHPNINKLMTLIFPIQYSFSRQALPLLRRNMLWTLNVGIINQYLARRENFFKQIDEVIMDLSIAEVWNIFYTPWAMLQPPKNELVSFSRRIPSGMLSALTDASMTHMRTSRTFRVPNDLEAAALLRRFESSLLATWTLSNINNLANDHVLRGLTDLRAKKPVEAEFVEFFYRSLFSIYSGTLRLIARNQVNPYRSHEKQAEADDKSKSYSQTQFEKYRPIKIHEFEELAESNHLVNGHPQEGER